MLCKECECDPVSWVCESCPAKYLCDDCNEDNHSKPDKKGHKRRTYDPDAEKKKAENSEPQAPSTTAQNQTKQASTAAIAVPEKIPKICVSCETDDVEFVCYTCTAERFLCEDCNSVKHGPKSDHDVRKSTDPPPPPPPQQQQQQQHEEKKVVDEKASAPTNQLQPGTQSVDHNAGAGNPKATVPPANYPSNFAARPPHLQNPSNGFFPPSNQQHYYGHPSAAPFSPPLTSSQRAFPGSPSSFGHAVQNQFHSVPAHGSPGAPDAQPSVNKPTANMGTAYPPSLQLPSPTPHAAISGQPRLYGSVMNPSLPPPPGSNPAIQYPASSPRSPYGSTKLWSAEQDTQRGRNPAEVLVDEKAVIKSTPMPKEKCDNCFSAIPILWCAECGEQFCQECDVDVHVASTSSLAMHKRARFVENPAQLAREALLKALRANSAVDIREILSSPGGRMLPFDDEVLRKAQSKAEEIECYEKRLFAAVKARSISGLRDALSQSHELDQAGEREETCKKFLAHLEEEDSLVHALKLSSKSSLLSTVEQALSSARAFRPLKVSRDGLVEGGVGTKRLAPLLAAAEERLGELKEADRIISMMRRGLSSRSTTEMRKILRMAARVGLSSHALYASVSQRYTLLEQDEAKKRERAEAQRQRARIAIEKRERERAQMRRLEEETLRIQREKEEREALRLKEEQERAEALRQEKYLAEETKRAEVERQRRLLREQKEQQEEDERIRREWQERNLQLSSFSASLSRPSSSPNLPSDYGDVKYAQGRDSEDRLTDRTAASMEKPANVKIAGGGGVDGGNSYRESATRGGHIYITSAKSSGSSSRLRMSASPRKGGSNGTSSSRVQRHASHHQQQSNSRSPRVLRVKKRMRKKKSKSASSVALRHPAEGGEGSAQPLLLDEVILGVERRLNAVESAQEKKFEVILNHLTAISPKNEGRAASSPVGRDVSAVIHPHPRPAFMRRGREEQDPYDVIISPTATTGPRSNGLPRHFTLDPTLGGDDRRSTEGGGGAVRSPTWAWGPTGASSNMRHANSLSSPPSSSSSSSSSQESYLNIRLGVSGLDFVAGGRGGGGHARGRGAGAGAGGVWEGWIEIYQRRSGRVVARTMTARGEARIAWKTIVLNLSGFSRTEPLIFRAYVDPYPILHLPPRQRFSSDVDAPPRLGEISLSWNDLKRTKETLRTSSVAVFNLRDAGVGTRMPRLCFYKLTFSRKKKAASFSQSNSADYGNLVPNASQSPLAPQAHQPPSSQMLIRKLERVESQLLYETQSKQRLQAQIQRMNEDVPIRLRSLEMAIRDVQRHNSEHQFQRNAIKSLTSEEAALRELEVLRKQRYILSENSDAEQPDSKNESPHSTRSSKKRNSRRARPHRHARPGKPPQQIRPSFVSPLKLPGSPRDAPVPKQAKSDVNSELLAATTLGNPSVENMTARSHTFRSDLALSEDSTAR